MVLTLVYSDYNHIANQLNLTLNNVEGYGTTRIFFFISVNKKLFADKHKFFATDIHCFSQTTKMSHIVCMGNVITIVKSPSR